jgi:hypothetical protein
MNALGAKIDEPEELWTTVKTELKAQHLEDKDIDQIIMAIKPS